MRSESVYSDYEALVIALQTSIRDYDASRS